VFYARCYLLFGCNTTGTNPLGSTGRFGPAHSHRRLAPWSLLDTTLNGTRGKYGDEREEIARDIHCRKRFTAPDSIAWEVDVEEEEFEEIEEDQFWEVRCSSCDHELEILEVV
jgi:hypothetical protein